MKTILAPTDFSLNAYTALAYCVQLLKTESCRFILLHSFENQVTHRTSRIDIAKTESVVDELYNDSEEKCEELKNRIINESSGENHTFDIITTSISLSRAINKLVEKENVDLIVMGSKGRTAAENVFMGSNTLTTLRKNTKAALLIIPKEISFRSIQNIAFVTGFKRKYLQNELKPIKYLASVQQAEVKVVHIHEADEISDLQRENFHALFKVLNDHNPEARWLTLDLDRHQTILNYLKKENMDLLAMVYYKHNFIAELFREAVVKNIAKKLPVPFLVIPAMD
mgnify:CR=1 FL=1|tara:strand:+ start:28270 stop:29118 length:849 start_codon:yes stop_codon:yes gene_type:complete